MKIAITSTENQLDSNLDSRFGRCSYFAIHNTKTKSTEFIINPNKNAPEGAGPASVQLVASQGVKQVISGEFGGKVISILNNLQIQMVMYDDNRTINEIIHTINNN